MTQTNSDYLNHKRMVTQRPRRFVSIMKLLLPLYVCITGFRSIGIDLDPFHAELSRMDRYMEPPPGLFARDSCYHYSELLRLEIDSHSKVTSISFNDAAADFLKEDLQHQKDRKQIRYAELNAIAARMKLKNCVLVFPFVVETDHFPCGQENKRRTHPPGYFRFDGKLLEGKVYFGEEIRFVWPVKFER